MNTRVRAGDEAGTLQPTGYLRVGYRGVSYLVHRVAWAIMTGAWPVCMLDHRDRARANNQWKNLRPATRLQNNVNAKRVRKVDLPRGAFPYGERFGSYICVRGKRRWLGMFDTADEAAAAYSAAAVATHGEYAPAI